MRLVGRLRIMLQPAILATLSLFSSVVPAAASAHLQVCVPYFDHYTRFVSAIIDESAPGTAMVSVTVYPSFRPEWAIRVTRQSGHLTLYALTFNSSIWGQVQRVLMSTNRHIVYASEIDTDVSIHTVRVTPRFVARLSAVITLAVDRSSILGESGVDGVMYQFSAGPSTCAQSWSPDSRTGPGRLVAMVDELRVLAGVKSPAIREAMQGTMVHQMQIFSDPGIYALWPGTPAKDWVNSPDFWYVARE